MKNESKSEMYQPVWLKKWILLDGMEAGTTGSEMFMAFIDRFRIKQCYQVFKLKFSKSGCGICLNTIFIEDFALTGNAVDKAQFY